MRIDRILLSMIFGILLLSSSLVQANPQFAWIEDIEEKAKLNISLYNLPLSTKAEILRPEGAIAIDFLKPEDISKIRDYDFVQLESARYDKLPTTAAKGLTFIGKDQKTSIGEISIFTSGSIQMPQGWVRTSIESRDTRFWDVAFGHIIFTNTEGRLVSVNSLHLEKQVRLAFDTSGIMRETGFLSIFSNFHLRSLPKDAHFSDFAYGTGLGFASWLNRVNATRPVEQRSTDIDSSRYFTQAKHPTLQKLTLKLAEARYESFKKNKPFFSKELAAEIAQHRAAILEEAKSGVFDYTQKGDAELVRQLLNRTLEYLAWKTGWTAPVDKEKLDLVLAKAKSDLDIGNAFLANARINQVVNTEFNDLYPPLIKLRNDIRNEIGKSYGCKINVDPGYAQERYGMVAEVTDKFGPYRRAVTRAYLETIQEWAKQNFPLMMLGTGSSVCTINIKYTKDEWTKHTSVSKVESTSNFVESDESLVRRQMLKDAAARQASKAAQAKWDGATEAMKDTARKMYDYRVRVEDVGDTKFLVYGKGNFAGQASAATKNKFNSADQKADELRAKAAQAPAGMKEVVTSSETFFDNYSYKMALDIKIERAGEQGRLFNGPESAKTWSQGPCKRTKTNGLFVGAVTGDCSTNGSDSSGGDMEAAYRRAYLLPFLDTYTAEVLYPIVFKRIHRGANSKDPSDQLESYLVAQFAGIKSKKTIQVEKLSEKALGKSLGSKQLQELAALQ